MALKGVVREMVIDYIKGFLFLTIYFLYIYLLGSIYPNDNSFYKKIIYGYLTTSLMAGILGVITQILFTMEFFCHNNDYLAYIGCLIRVVDD